MSGVGSGSAIKPIDLTDSSPELLPVPCLEPVPGKKKRSRKRKLREVQCDSSALSSAAKTVEVRRIESVRKLLTDCSHLQSLLAAFNSALPLEFADAMWRPSKFGVYPFEWHWDDACVASPKAETESGSESAALSHAIGALSLSRSAHIPTLARSLWLESSGLPPFCLSAARWHGAVLSKLTAHCHLATVTRDSGTRKPLLTVFPVFQPTNFDLCALTVPLSQLSVADIRFRFDKRNAVRRAFKERIRDGSIRLAQSSSSTAATTEASKRLLLEQLMRDTADSHSTLIPPTQSVADFLQDLYALTHYSLLKREQFLRRQRAEATSTGERHAVDDDSDDEDEDDDSVFDALSDNYCDSASSFSEMSVKLQVCASLVCAQPSEEKGWEKEMHVLVESCLQNLPNAKVATAKGNVYTVLVSNQSNLMSRTQSLRVFNARLDHRKADVGHWLLEDKQATDEGLDCCKPLLGDALLELISTNVASCKRALAGYSHTAALGLTPSPLVRIPLFPNSAHNTLHALDSAYFDVLRHYCRKTSVSGGIQKLETSPTYEFDIPKMTDAKLSGSSEEASAKTHAFERFESAEECEDANSGVLLVLVCPSFTRNGTLQTEANGDSEFYGLPLPSQCTGFVVFFDSVCGKQKAAVAQKCKRLCERVRRTVECRGQNLRFLARMRMETQLFGALREKQQSYAREMRHVCGLLRADSEQMQQFTKPPKTYYNAYGALKGDVLSLFKMRAERSKAKEVAFVEGFEQLASGGPALGGGPIEVELHCPKPSKKQTEDGRVHDTAVGSDSLADCGIHPKRRKLQPTVILPPSPLRTAVGLHTPTTRTASMPIAEDSAADKCSSPQMSEAFLKSLGSDGAQLDPGFVESQRKIMQQFAKKRRNSAMF